MWARGFNKSGSEGGKQAGYITYRILYKASTLLSSRAIISFSEGTFPSLWSYFLTVPLCKMYCTMAQDLSTDTSTAGKPRWRNQYNEQATGWTIWGSNPSRGKIFFFSRNRPNWLWSPPVLLLEWVPGFLLRVRATGAWCWPLTFI